MNLTPQIKYLCELYDIVPSRSKGQNFLISEKIYDDIIQAADLEPHDVVLEIGPGLGFLTAKLAKKAKRVIAVELDDKLAQVLRDGLNMHNVKNVEVVNKDILTLKAGDLKLEDKNYKVVANLPYNITSIFLRKFLSEEKARPESLTLMLQKEVAQRIVAKPPKMSMLAVSVQFYSLPKIIRQVSKGNFWPSPKVDSAIIKLDSRPERIEIDERKFFRLAKFGFSSKRRMLKNNLAAGLQINAEEAEAGLEAVGLNPKIRAEGLTIENWVKLFGELGKFMV
ncbi:MAG: 16S rRNA (adenine(1518)-N(6)/adenine(1519)-N(6))-dimethyltransferase RsmA [Patescibacteria group bacterium]|jgi:16S rRNA (adenine1518-N6/adenine1519-N6)-dimethyltransferase